MDFTAPELATMKQAIEASTIRGIDAREIVGLLDKIDNQIIKLTNTNKDDSNKGSESTK